jgi:hypothetical protein
MNINDVPVVLWQTGGRKCVLVRESTDVLTFHVKVSDDMAGDLKYAAFNDEQRTVEFALAEMYAATAVDGTRKPKAESTVPNRPRAR